MRNNYNDDCKGNFVYPSSSTIPFPFPTGPYKQQADLMDTMLQTLELIDRDENDNRQANIMMLESPTGTGKSLSLACAAIAWLKHREQVDFAKMTEREDKDAKTEKVKGNSNPKSKNEPISWLDAWAPPEQLEREKAMLERRETCHERASSTRKALETELDIIRHRIRNKMKIIRTSTDSLRNVREHVAKVAVDQKRRETSSGQSRLGQKRARSLIDTNSTKEDEDFCVEAFATDNEVAPRTGNSTRARSYDYDSLDDDSDNDSKSTLKSNMEMEQKQVQNINLLDGGQLDGSGFRVRQNYSKTDRESSSHEQKNQVDLTIGEVQPGSGVRKIVYAARTHSQLSQFVDEIRRTAWGDSIRVVTLGGRKLLCCNTDVTGHDRRRSEANITEKCLDMQKGIAESTEKSGTKRTKSKTSCPLLAKNLLPTLALHMLAKPSDIEDLAGLGKSTNTCSYYASRESLKAAEVVVVPYNTLLSKSTRDAVGLSLKKSLVIVDEAHNIPEALRSLSSSKLTLTIIDRAIEQLKAYVAKYKARLAGRNIFYLGQILKFLNQCAKHLKTKQRKKQGSKSMVTATELLFVLKLDNLNLFDIIAYLEKSRLSQKLHGFNSAIQQAKIQGSKVDTDDPEFMSKHVSSMSIVEAFLKCLTSSQKEGRVIIETPKIESAIDDQSKPSKKATPCFRYFLLDPSNEFKNVVNEAHSVVLAGGTLRPFAHVATELFGSQQELVEQAKGADGILSANGISSHSNATVSALLSTFTCGHVVPSANIHMTCLGKGPNGVGLDFRHSSRFRNELCDDLGESIIKLSKVTPNGMVVFFPSYSYETFVVNRWKNTRAFEKIKEEKRLYREPQSASYVESTLSSFSKHASSENGAVLLCVIGGKMSEGINFANEMARCVFIVGLPYPDITDPELKEKMELMDKEQQAISGQEYYQNLCMRAVNQSIGRAIRHAKDYAAIILGDVRYCSSPKIWKGLPEWLRTNTEQSSKSFDQNLFEIGKFFDRVVNSSE